MESQPDISISPEKKREEALSGLNMFIGGEITIKDMFGRVMTKLSPHEDFEDFNGFAARTVDGYLETERFSYAIELHDRQSWNAFIRTAEKLEGIAEKLEEYTDEKIKELEEAHGINRRNWELKGKEGNYGETMRALEEAKGNQRMYRARLGNTTKELEKMGVVVMKK